MSHYDVLEVQIEMTDKYESLTHAVQEAGFFTNGVEQKHGWDRTCICARRDEDGRLTGNSFWVTKLRGDWYLGTWRDCLYRLPDANRIADLCVTWLRRVPRGTRPDFDESIKADFALVLVSDEEFAQLMEI